MTDTTCKSCAHFDKQMDEEPCNSCDEEFDKFEEVNKDLKEKVNVEKFDAVHQVKHYQLFGGDKQVYDLIRDRLDALVDSKHTKDLTQAQQLEVAAWYKDVIKYTMRWMGKDGIQDLKKTKEYIDKILEVYES